MGEDLAVKGSRIVDELFAVVRAASNASTTRLMLLGPQASGRK